VPTVRVLTTGVRVPIHIMTATLFGERGRGGRGAAARLREWLARESSTEPPTEPVPGQD
jgi:hypothetical protein